MSFFKKFIIILFVLIFCKVTFADNHETDTTTENVNTTVEEELEEEVPLNDPFAGNEGTSTFTNTNTAGLESEELENDMSLYKFKLVGLISGNFESYISLVNSSGEVITLNLFDYLGDIKFVDLRLTEAIFQKEDKTYMIIDFNNQIRETDNYYE